MSKPAATKKETPGKKFLLLPVSTVVFFFLHNLNQYKELILIIEVLLLFLVYSVFALIVFWAVKKLVKLSFFQSIFLSTVIMIFFLFFGALQDFLSKFKKYPYLGNSFVLFLLFLLTFILLLIVIKRKNILMVRPAKYLALVFIIIISIEIIGLGFNIFRGKTIYSLTRRMRSAVLDDKKIETNDRPDIYHILFDSYANAPSLKQYWGYENEIYPFLDSMGFYTVDSGFSNYNSTPYSFSSIFNLQYLDGAESYLLSNSSNFYIGQKVFSENAFFRFLKNNNYKFSVFSQVENKRLMLSLGILGVTPPTTWLRKQTFERVYLDPWILDKIKNPGRSTGKQPELINKSMQNFIDYNKKALDHIFSDCRNALNHNLPQGPIFSFTHILLPHDPYMLDENGKPVVAPTPGGHNMNPYLAQLKYCNTLIKQITRSLLADTTRKKIIIFQGDHGYRHYDFGPYSAQFGALNAIYFYNKNYSGLKKNMSHVNTYRVVVNNFFNGRLPLLKDSIVAMKN